MSQDEMVKTGNCLCGAVTYRFSGPVNWCAHCHCESCRRNTASPFTTFFGVPDTAYRFTGMQPASYSSSNGVKRLFCSVCGTPVAYASTKYPNEVHFYLASLNGTHDDVTPQAHVHWEEHVDWVMTADDLPRK